MGFTFCFALIGAVTGFICLSILGNGLPSDLRLFQLAAGVWICGGAIVGALIGLAGHLSWLADPRSKITSDVENSGQSHSTTRD
jgi:hypothetical protein